jgi:hypothetical protein
MMTGVYQMRQIERIYLTYLFTFKKAYFYAFIAGIMVSLAVNLFTTALLTKDLSIAVWRVHGMAISLFISSLGAFGISALLETSRSDWERDGAQLATGMSYVKKYRDRILGFLLLFIIGFSSSIFWYSDVIFNYYSQLF